MSLLSNALAIVGVATVVIAGLAAVTGNLVGLGRAALAFRTWSWRRRGEPDFTVLDQDSLSSEHWTFTGEMEDPSALISRQFRFHLVPKKGVDQFTITRAVIETDPDALVEHDEPAMRMTLHVDMVDVGTSEPVRWPAMSTIHVTAKLRPLPEGRYILRQSLRLSLTDERGNVLTHPVGNGRVWGDRPNVQHRDHRGRFWVPTPQGPRRLTPEEEPTWPGSIEVVESMIKQWEIEDPDWKLRQEN